MTRVPYVVLLALGLSGCYGRPGERWNGGPVPQKITAGWYVANHPNCIDDCGAAEGARREALWARIRERPDLVEALIEVVESRRDSWTRSNATLNLGFTAQERAHRYLVAALDTAGDDDVRTRLLLAFGSGNRPVPSYVYGALERTVSAGYFQGGSAAISTLAALGTERARAILQHAASRGPDQYTQTFARQALQAWKPRPDREP